MTVESASYISQLDTTLPTAADLISEGDDHLRLTKAVLKTQFPNFGTTAIAASAVEVNYCVGVTSAILAGATYYDTTLVKARVWSGVAWADGISAVAGVASLNGESGNIVKTTLAGYGITDALPLVDALSIAYNGDGTIATLTEDGVVKAFAYNGDGTIDTVSWPVGALTRTETYSYASGVLTGMAATEV